MVQEWDVRNQNYKVVLISSVGTELLKEKERKKSLFIISVKVAKKLKVLPHNKLGTHAYSSYVFHGSSQIFIWNWIGYT